MMQCAQCAGRTLIFSCAVGRPAAFFPPRAPLLIHWVTPRAECGDPAFYGWIVQLCLIGTPCCKSSGKKDASSSCRFIGGHNST